MMRDCEPGVSDLIRRSGCCRFGMRCNVEVFGMWVFSRETKSRRGPEMGSFQHQEKGTVKSELIPGEHDKASKECLTYSKRTSGQV